MKLIESLKSLILERTFLDSFTSNNVRVNVYYNEHSQSIKKGNSILSRVDKEQILKSLLEVKEVIAKVSLRILDDCEGKKCAFIIRDYADGVDSHFWIRLSRKGDLNIILNTSINHPRNLFNTIKVPVINVDLMGNVNIAESENRFIVGKKVVTIENL